MNRLWTLLLAGAAGLSTVSSAGAFPGCPGSGQQSSGPDVIVGRLAQVQTTAQIANYSSAGGIETFSVGTTSCNLGNAQLLWEQSPDPDHPVIGQNCFRLKTVNGSTRFEQLGQSWLKHGFTALQQGACCSNCQSSGTGSRLGIGCSDPYDATRNGGQSSAGPKWQVNATTGVHTQPKANPPGSTATTVSRRLQIKVPDLEPSNFMVVTSPKYFVEGQYVAADDAANGNAYNNASYRPITVSGSGTAWTFGVFGDQDTETRRQEPGVFGWKEFDTDIVITDIVSPEDGGRTARVILASKVTDLGGGTWHYEYAFQNLNSDRSIRSVSIPVSPYATVTNIGFHDVDYHSGDGKDSTSTATLKNYDGTDWPGAFVPANASISWAVVETSGTYPGNANALRWGTLYNFRFDCNLAPAATNPNATIGQYKTVNSFTAETQAPASVTCLPGDMNTDGLVDGGDISRFTDVLVNGGATPTEKCAGDRAPTADYVIGEDDIDGFTSCVLNAGC